VTVEGLTLFDCLNATPGGDRGQLNKVDRIDGCFCDGPDFMRNTHFFGGMMRIQKISL
jgi:hypothetical protein